MSIWKLELMEALNDIAPESDQDHWDNGGIQLDLGEYEIHRILVALEVTTEVIKEANEVAADYLVVHHPLIFNPISNIDANEVTGSFLTELIQAGIGVYASHTAFDRAKGGNNQFLAKKLSLIDIQPLIPFHPDEGVPGVKGGVKETTTLLDMCQQLSYVLEEDKWMLRMVGNPDKAIRKVAIVTGAGGSCVKDAVLNGCDLLITGDVKYHDACLARETGLAVIDGGHYGTEKAFVPNMVHQLLDRIGNKAEVIPSKAVENPFWIIK